MTTRLEVYNDALQRLGAELLETETEDREVRHQLDAVWTGGALANCFKLAEPVFARCTVNLSAPTTVSTHGDYQYRFDLPADYLRLIGVFTDGSLDQANDRRLVEKTYIYSEASSIWLRYVSDQSADPSSWSECFASYVAAYIAHKLGPRICPGKMEVLVAELDATREEVLTINAAEEVAARPSKSANAARSSEFLPIYNQALALVGADRIPSTSADDPNRYKIDDLLDAKEVEALLREVLPNFARQTVALNTPTASTASGFAYEHTLPADYLALVSVFSDANLDEEVSRKLVEGGSLYSDRDIVYVRYIKDVTQTPVVWSPDFQALVISSIAMKLAPTDNASLMDQLQNAFYKQRSKVAAQSQAEDDAARPQRVLATITQEMLTIYNDALMILGRDTMTTTTDDRFERVLFDNAINGQLVSEILADKLWTFARTTIQIQENKALQPIWGYDHVHELPNDVILVDGLFRDECQHHPLKDYRLEELRRIYCWDNVIYVTYVSQVYETQPSYWPAHFKRYISAALANVVRNDTRFGFNQSQIANIVDEYKRRKHDAESRDFRESPPIRIRQGSWVNARYQGPYQSGRRRYDY